MRELKKILFITSGVFPFVPKSDQSFFVRNLLQGIFTKKAEIRVFMPKYGIISERRYQLHEVVRFSGTNLKIDDHFLFVKVASLPLSRLQVYFVDNEEFFKRKYLFHDEQGREFLDNDERSVFFVRGVIEVTKKLGWMPNIIHCHGWMTSLVPFFIRKHHAKDLCFKNVRFVYSVYNDGLKRPFSNLLTKELRRKNFITHNVEYLNDPLHYENLTRLGIDFSDGVLVQNTHPLFSSLEAYLNKKKPIFFLPPVLSDSIDIESIDNFYDQLLL